MIEARERTGKVGDRIAVVLFNLGGPDSPEAVQPFLFNLFNDPAIVGAPQPLRWCLATLVSHRRAPTARKIYAEIGGASPLNAETRSQAEALARALSDLGAVKVVIAMRYWHPMSDAAAAEVAAFNPDRVVLLPLYPQFSSTTTASSFAAWERAAAREGLTAPVHRICCYPTEPGFVAAHAALIEAEIAAIGAERPFRVLFSAHGLPKKIVARGDPYVWQVERTAQAIADALAARCSALDWTVCYQSRVGPLEWVGPSTADELARAGRDRVAVVLTPIAFVSEHSETLVELDIEYRRLAENAGVPLYRRAPALGTAPLFIETLAGLIRRALAAGPGLAPCDDSAGACPRGFRLCPRRGKEV